MACGNNIFIKLLPVRLPGGSMSHGCKIEHKAKEFIPGIGWLVIVYRPCWCVCEWVCMHVSLHVCTCVWMCLCVCVRACVCMCMCKCVACVCVCMVLLPHFRVLISVFHCGLKAQTEIKNSFFLSKTSLIYCSWKVGSQWIKIKQKIWSNSCQNWNIT